MDVALDAVYYAAAAIMAGIACYWTYMIRAMVLSFAKTPVLGAGAASCSKKAFGTESGAMPDPKDGPGLKDELFVSIILPARNEEDCIAKCLDSLLSQNYGRYEIVAVDDSSEDETGNIIRRYAGNEKIVPVSARPKPPDWVGKNWACCEGYDKASGDLLLFTDADTVHSENALSLAVSRMLSDNLDAITISPRMLCFDFWTKTTLPVISTFLHTRFSPLKVNDPKSRVGYFFGSFFIIKRAVYESAGTHKSVRHEIVEDGALGGIVKKSGCKMRMLRGEHLVDAIWARSASTLWNALKRLMVPIYLQSKWIATGILAAVAFLLFAPFPVLAYGVVFGLASSDAPSHHALFWSSLASSALIYAANFAEAAYLKSGTQYGILAPLGGLVVVLGFLSSLIHAKSKSAVSWRGRSYSMKDHAKTGIEI